METQDYDELLKNYKKLQIELETVKQALYECQRQRKTIQTLEAEYQDEIRILQTEGRTEQQKLEAKVRLLEEEIINLKTMHHEQISYLEKELIRKEDEIKKLAQKIEDMIKIAENRDFPSDDKLIEEISELKQQHMDLSFNFGELNKALVESEAQKVALEETIKRQQQELENYKEMIKCKREELEEANTLIQNLKDDYLCVKADLDSVRSTPLDDQSRGNSLFAEVDDRRVQLQQNMNAMKSQYIEMKRERASYMKQIAALRNENMTLIVKYQQNSDCEKRDEEIIFDSYKFQIQTLNELIESYKKELKEKDQNLEEITPNQTAKLYDGLLAMKNEEIEELRKSLRNRSFNHTTLAYNLAEANRQIRRYDLENIRLKNEIGKLKNEIEEIKLGNMVENTLLLDPKIPKSIGRSTKTVENIDLTDKDNENKNPEKKKVQFAENTIEPQITDRNKNRKGPKCMVLKPRIYE